MSRTMATKTQIISLGALLCAAALLWPETALASDGLPADGLLNRVADNFIQNVQNYSAPIAAAAERLFWMLLSCAIVVTGAKMIFKQGDPSSFAAVMVRLILTTGVFYFLLKNGARISASVIDSMIEVSGHYSVGPSELLDITFNTTKQLHMAISKSLAALPAALVMNLLIAVYSLIMFLVTIRYITLYISAYVFCTLGVFVLGFGAFGYTRVMAVSYLKTVLSLALQLMTMIIICNIGFQVLNDLSTAIAELDKPLTFQDAGVVLFTSLFLMVLCSSLPRLVGSLVCVNPATGTLSFNVPGLPKITPSR